LVKTLKQKKMWVPFGHYSDVSSQYLENWSTSLKCSSCELVIQKLFCTSFGNDQKLWKHANMLSSFYIILRS
jgi:hypothetical protein